MRDSYNFGALRNQFFQSIGLQDSVFVNVKDFQHRLFALTKQLPRDDVAVMFRHGYDHLVTLSDEEARRLCPLRHENALNTVGYKELFRYLDGEWELPFAVEKIKKNTRDYAKKQMTWFAHDASIRWFHPDEALPILNIER